MVSIMKVNPHGQDHIVALTLASKNHFSGFRGTKGASYYISLSGSDSSRMAWYIPLYGPPFTLCSGAFWLKSGTGNDISEPRVQEQGSEPESEEDSSHSLAVSIATFCNLRSVLGVCF